MRPFRGAGTVLNFLTVLVGALIGLGLRTVLQGRPDLLESVKFSLGIVTICIGVKLFLAMRSPVVVAISVAVGGLIGVWIGLDQMVNNGALWLQGQFGGDPDFKRGLIVASLVFCVGPMTVLGCLRDAIDRDIDLLKLKATMDGLVAIFFAAAFGAGVAMSAFVVLTVQGLLTAAALPLRGFASDQDRKFFTEKLQDLLKENSITSYGHYRFLGYDPPYQMTDRRNEIVVAVKWKE